MCLLFAVLAGVSLPAHVATLGCRLKPARWGLRPLQTVSQGQGGRPSGETSADRLANPRDSSGKEEALTRLSSGRHPGGAGCCGAHACPWPPVPGGRVCLKKAQQDLDVRFAIVCDAVFCTSQTKQVGGTRVPGS